MKTWITSSWKALVGGAGTGAFVIAELNHIDAGISQTTQAGKIAHTAIGALVVGVGIWFTRNKPKT